jgi:hypothetical protein
MKVMKIAVMVAAVMVFFFSASVQAAMIRVNVNAITTNYPSAVDRQLNISIEVFSNTQTHPPSYVGSIDVEAPDETALSLDPKKDWRPYDRSYGKAFKATDFIGGIIPGGTYKVTVTPTPSGASITETDDVPTKTDLITASLLPVPVVTKPEDGDVVLTETLEITWNAVKEAAYYVLLLWNNTLNEPVYWTWEKQYHTDFTKIILLPGVLKPDSEYTLRIEARSGSQDFDRRSRSKLIHFTTGSW